ncbi:hypothetical protein [Klebsiella pneumoniae]|uniref:hypothetical protein n=1 Tax=Klebsiella pneumoniae TaxID=573 RepID=UPI001D17F2D6|nr:hypothetical protein [Klebsiella pneumoniae]
MTNITELAQSLKRRATSANEFGESLYVKADDILTLVEAVEKAQGMETYWKTQCRGITDHCEELQARIAELESHTVKPPVHPTVASEKLDDETLQELIEFRRTTFEYHSKEGNKVQTIIHGVTLAALRELQERRKADSEPVAEVVSIYGDPEAFGEREIRPLVGIQQMPYGTKLYRHAQPAPASPVCTCPSGDGSLRWPCPVHPGNSPAIPDGYVMVPMRLTAENGAKGALSGEFSETKFVNCPECFGDDECETCDGSGRIEITVPVTWTTIKDIWAKGVEHFAAAPQEVKGEQGRTD